MSVVPPPKEEMKSPLEDFCAQRLEEFGDLDEAARREAAESIRRVCESSDSDSCLVRITTPSILTSPDEHTTPEPGRGAASRLSDADVQGAVGSTLRFLNTDLIETPVEEQPRRFKAFLDRVKKSGEEASSSERFKIFMMLTTAKEYVMRKWRKVITKQEVEDDLSLSTSNTNSDTDSGDADAEDSTDSKISTDSAS